MSFTAEQLAEARQRIPLEDLIGRDVALRRRGSEWAGLCPFHREKSPSFFVVPTKGFFTCFGCGARGDAIDYLRQSRNLSFVDAVQELLGSQIDDKAYRKRKSEPAPKVDKTSEIEAARKLLQPPAGPITERTGAWLYLYSRGLSTDQPGLREHPGLLWSEETDGPGDEAAPWRRWYSNRRKVWVRGAEFPALLAPVKDSAGHITAVHQIWCVSRYVVGEVKDARAPVSVRKKTRGDLRDGAVRLGPAAPIMGLAEGIETGIAASMLYRIPVWVALGTARFGAPQRWTEPPLQAVKGEDGIWRVGDRIWHPSQMPERPPSIWIPDTVEHLVIFGDRGAAGEMSANFAAQWWRNNRRITTEAVFPKEPHSDFNDLLLAKIGEAA